MILLIVLKFTTLKNWIDANAKYVTIFNILLLDHLKQYPLVVFNNLPEPAKVYTGDDHFVLVALCDTPNDVIALDNLNCEYVAIINQWHEEIEEEEKNEGEKKEEREGETEEEKKQREKDEQKKKEDDEKKKEEERKKRLKLKQEAKANLTDDLIKRQKDLSELCKTWNSLFDQDEYPNKVRRTQIDEHLSMLEKDLYSKSLVALGLEKLLVEDVQDMQNASTHFLLYKETMKEPDNVVIKPAKTLAIPSKRLQTSLDVTHPVLEQQVLPKNDLLTPVLAQEKLDEITLASKTDPLTFFLSLACGIREMTIVSLFVDVPKVSKVYNTYNQEKYMASLHSFARSALYNTSNELQRMSNHKFDILTLLPYQQTNLFLVTANLCGLYMHEYKTKNPSRSITTKWSSAAHLKDLNDVREDMIYLIEKAKGVDFFRL